mmetsp:Transcript_26893/g.82525  ORF Transcript_26893/g.82525 Transcript_26893/m.82525 type:complete len:229 (-) Transcript_26893:1312-1998(-)
MKNVRGGRPDTGPKQGLDDDLELDVAAEELDGGDEVVAVGLGGGFEVEAAEVGDDGEVEVGFVGSAVAEEDGRGEANAHVHDVLDADHARVGVAPSPRGPANGAAASVDGDERGVGPAVAAVLNDAHSRRRQRRQTGHFVARAAPRRRKRVLLRRRRRSLASRRRRRSLRFPAGGGRRVGRPRQLRRRAPRQVLGRRRRRPRVRRQPGRLRVVPPRQRPMLLWLGLLF